MRFAGIVALSLGLSMVGLSDGLAYKVKLTPAGSLVRWRTDRPLRVAVDASQVGVAKRELLEEAIGGAVAEWNGASALRVGIDVSAPAESGIRVEWTPDVWGADHDQLAITTLEYDSESGEILRATIRVNDAFLWIRPAGTEVPIFDLQGTLTHELGHAYGLAHSDVPGATMFLGSHSGQQTKRTLHADDVAAVVALYGAPGGPALVEAPVVDGVGCSVVSPARFASASSAGADGSSSAGASSSGASSSGADGSTSASASGPPGSSRSSRSAAWPIWPAMLAIVLAIRRRSRR